MTRRLERDLLAAGERIARVPPKLMAHARDSARTYGNSDPIDALAVARCAAGTGSARRSAGWPRTRYPAPG
jgi:transposase